MEANLLGLNEYSSGHSTGFALSDRPPPAAPPVSHRRVGVFHTLSGCLKRGRKVGARQNPAGTFGNLSFGAIFTLEKIFNKKDASTIFFGNQLRESSQFGLDSRNWRLAAK